MPKESKPIPDVAITAPVRSSHEASRSMAKMHGNWEFFRKDGSLMRSGQFNRGCQVGIWRTFDRTGTLVKETEFSKRS